MHAQGRHGGARSCATDSNPHRTGTLSALLAHHDASTRFEDLPPRAVAGAKRVMFDTLGVTQRLRELGRRG